MTGKTMGRTRAMKAMLAAAGLLIATLLLCLLPAGQARAAQSDLAFVSYSGDTVTGSGTNANNYTVYVRDGDTVDVTLKVKNNSGEQLDYVTMTGYPSYPAATEDDDDFEPITFPPYKSNDALVTGASDSYPHQWYTTETAYSISPGYSIAAGNTATFKMKLNAGNLEPGTYNWNIQLGRIRYDHE